MQNIEETLKTQLMYLTKQLLHLREKGEIDNLSENAKELISIFNAIANSVVIDRESKLLVSKYDLILAMDSFQDGIEKHAAEILQLMINHFKEQESNTENLSSFFELEEVIRDLSNRCNSLVFSQPPTPYQEPPSLTDVDGEEISNDHLVADEKERYKADMDEYEENFAEIPRFVADVEANDLDKYYSQDYAKNLEQEEDEEVRHSPTRHIVTKDRKRTRMADNPYGTEDDEGRIEQIAKTKWREYLH